MFTKHYLGFMPKSGFETLPIWFLGLFMIIKLVGNKKNSLESLQINIKVLLWLVVICVSQFISMEYSIAEIGSMPFNFSIVKGFATFIFLIMYIFIIYYAINLLIISKETMFNFIKSIFLTFIIYEILVIFPQVLSSLTSGKMFNSWVNLLGSLFEQRWDGRHFYDNGSYVTTLFRVNGLTPEAGYLAAQIGIVLIPFLLAAIRNNQMILVKNKSISQLINWVFLIGTLAILLFAKTTTGFLVIGLTLFCLIIFADGKQRIIYSILGILILSCIYVLYQNNMYINALVSEFLVDKTGTSNRLGGTLGLLYTFIQHPVSGVGYNYHWYFLDKNVPVETKKNVEYIYVYAVSGYPILSVVLGWFAEFGLITIIPMLTYIFRKIKQAFGLGKKYRVGTFEHMIVDAFYIFIVMYAVLSTLIFTWSETYYLCVFFALCCSLKIMGDKN